MEQLKLYNWPGFELNGKNYMITVLAHDIEEARKLAISKVKNPEIRDQIASYVYNSKGIENEKPFALITDATMELTP